MYKKKLYIAIGISGQGKSTVANQMEMEDSSIVRVSSDEIREELLGADYVYQPSDNRRVFQVMNKKVKETLKEGYSVFYDATNLRKDFREDLIHEMLPYTDRIVALYFPVDIEKAQERNAKRTKRMVPSDVIARMGHSIELPEYAEGYDEITTILQ